MEALKHFWLDKPNDIEESNKSILNTNSIYTITDSYGIIEYANDNFCKVLDSNVNKVIGVRHELLNSEFQSLEANENLWSTIKEGEEWRGVLTDKLKNGESISLKTTIYPIKYGNQNKIKFLSIYEDISNCMTLNQKIDKDEALYELIYKSINIGIIIVANDNGSIIKWNEGAEKAFGYSEFEILGQQLSVLMIEKHKKSKISDFLELLKRYKTVKKSEVLELKCLNKLGEEFSVELIISKWNIDGEGYYILKMLDITKRVAFQNKLKQKTKELELFFYRSAHDLSAPFSSAQGLINLIKGEESIEKIQILIEMLEKTINHAKVFSDGLSNASLISKQSHELKIIDFPSLVNNVLKMLHGENKFENIKINVDIENCQSFRSNPDLLLVVFKNLIQNAIKYSFVQSESHAPFIDIKVTSSDNEVVILIGDNGKGIAKKELNKIFNLYYRTEAEHCLGTNGLGLYIVKSIIESLNGKIKVETEINKGACFVIKIPRTI
jgi:PAS domain S-box-containing protein